MRTKALLCAAAVAAGAFTSMAQSNVYSLNIVGYVNTPLTVGFNLIANPLDNGTNTVSSLFPNASEGDTVILYGGGTFPSSTLTFGTWSNPSLLIPPGVGAFYQSLAATTTTNTFVGNVLTGNLTNHITAPFSLSSSQVPQADTFSNLGFPAAEGDAVYFLRGGTYTGNSYSYSFGSWLPSDPIPGVGEGFWVQTGAAKDWVRVFNP